MQPCRSVKLRTRKVINGMLSYYLDYYPGLRNPHTMKTVRRESLGIYIYENPINRREKQYNETMREKAETIRCRRFESVINERYDFLDKEKMKGDFLAYFAYILKTKDKKWQYVYTHFERFVDKKCTFEEVDVNLCRKFRAYLLQANNLSTGKKMAINSVAGYWSTFRGFLKIAFREKMIKENVNEYLDRIEYEPTEKERLTLTELKKLYNTPCRIEVLKKASIFACLTGLRRSDIIALTWNHIKNYADGGKYVEFISQKTKERNIIALSDFTYSLIAPSGKGKIFVGFTTAMTQHPLKEWLTTANLGKHITFHSFRHSFASLQLELGTDIYTVQSLLAHKSVTTTQLYARHADPKTREAAARLSLEMLNSVQSAPGVQKGEDDDVVKQEQKKRKNIENSDNT